MSSVRRAFCIQPRTPKKQTATSSTISARYRPTPLRSILKRPSAASASSPASLPRLSESAHVSSPSDRLDDPLPTIVRRGRPAANATASAKKPLDVMTWRRPDVLDNPIAVCTRFATWLETQTCVRADTILRAVERDGGQFLSLAKATVMFDNALRGDIVPDAPAENGVVDTPLGEHARALRVFAELLRSKISEGSLNKELETAVLRDGEALLRLALRCLEFEEAIRGSAE